MVGPYAEASSIHTATIDLGRGKHFSATIKKMETVSRKVIATRAMPATSLCVVILDSSRQLLPMRF